MGGRCGDFCDLSYHSSGENSRSELSGSCVFGSLQCSFCFSLAEEHKHSHGHQPYLSVHFLHLSPSKGIQRNMMGKGAALGGALGSAPRAWVPGQASMAGLPTGRGPILASPWCGQVPGGRTGELPSGGLKKTLE